MYILHANGGNIISLHFHDLQHGLRTPREEIAFTTRPKIQSQSQTFTYDGSIFCLPHRPNFSNIFDLCLHWVSVVRDLQVQVKGPALIDVVLNFLPSEPSGFWLSSSHNKYNSYNFLHFIYFAHPKVNSLKELGEF